MSHVTCEWVMSRANESHHPNTSRVRCQSCHIKKSRHTWNVMSQKWGMSHVNGACQMWMGRVTCKCVMSHMNESSHHHTTGVLGCIWVGAFATGTGKKIQFLNLFLQFLNLFLQFLNLFLQFLKSQHYSRCTSTVSNLVAMRLLNFDTTFEFIFDTQKSALQSMYIDCQI